MKKIIASLALLFTLSTSAWAQEQPTGLKVGDTAPVFTAKDQDGNSFSLADALAKGPVVVIFYRGQWCPFCNKQLAELEKNLAAVKEKGGTIFAISPEAPVNLKKTIEKTKASFPVLHDEGMAIMKAYKVNFKVEEKYISMLKKYGIDLAASNGENGENLPVPATYVIGKDGVIKFVHFNPDYKERATIKAILENL
jgi:peroxiredoxin